MPRPCSRLAKVIGTSVMFIFGWKKAGNIPRHKNVVVIAAPHTSNWDFIFLIAAAYSFGFSINWLGKDSLFKTPLSPIFRFLGGIPVNRSEPGNLVKTITERIRTRQTISYPGSPCFFYNFPTRFKYYQRTRRRRQVRRSRFYFILLHFFLLQKPFFRQNSRAI